MIKGFDHVGTDHQCSICQCDFTDDEGGIQGYLGILPVAFCPFCFAGIDDMMQQLNEREWEGLTEEERYELLSKADWVHDPESYAVLVEAKLKEKNGYE